LERISAESSSWIMLYTGDLHSEWNFCTGRLAAETTPVQRVTGGNEKNRQRRLS
jgi:hypothetical protein